MIAWISFDWAYHQVSHYVAFDGRTVQFGSPYEHAVIRGVTNGFVLVNNPWLAPDDQDSSQQQLGQHVSVVGVPGVRQRQQENAHSKPPPFDRHPPLPERRLEPERYAHRFIF